MVRRLINIIYFAIPIRQLAEWNLTLNEKGFIRSPVSGLPTSVSLEEFQVLLLISFYTVLVNHGLTPFIT